MTNVSVDICCTELFRKSIRKCQQFLIFSGAIQSRQRYVQRKNDPEIFNATTNEKTEDFLANHRIRIESEWCKSFTCKLKWMAIFPIGSKLRDRPLVSIGGFCNVVIVWLFHSLSDICTDFQLGMLWIWLKTKLWVWWREPTAFKRWSINWRSYRANNANGKCQFKLVQIHISSMISYAYYLPINRPNDKCLNRPREFEEKNGFVFVEKESKLFG